MAAPDPHKREWPELVGELPEDAKATILAERPGLNVEIIPQGRGVTRELKYNRVRIFVGSARATVRFQVVTPIPHIECQQKLNRVQAKASELLEGVTAKQGKAPARMPRRSRRD